MPVYRHIYDWTIVDCDEKQRIKQRKIYNLCRNIEHLKSQFSQNVLTRERVYTRPR